jgi:hypothetical protein
MWNGPNYFLYHPKIEVEDRRKPGIPGTNLISCRYMIKFAPGNTWTVVGLALTRQMRYPPKLQLDKLWFLLPSIYQCRNYYYKLLASWKSQVRVPMTAAEFPSWIARDILCVKKAAALLSPVDSISRFPMSFKNTFASYRQYRHTKKDVSLLPLEEAPVAYENIYQDISIINYKGKLEVLHISPSS